VAEAAAPFADPAPAAPIVETSAPTASGGSCESCGGPSSEGTLCESCQSAFQFVIAPSTAPTAPQSISDADDSAPAQAAFEFSAAVVESPAPDVASVEAVATEPEPVAVIEPEPALLPVPISVPFNDAPAVSAQNSKAQRMGLAVAAVIAVAVMGVPLGVWLGIRHQPHSELPPPAAAPQAQKAAVAPAPVATVAAAAKHSEVVAPAPVVVDPQPKTAVTEPSPAKGSKLTPAKPRKPEPARRPVALQAAPVPVVQGLAALPAPVVAAQPVELPRVATPTPPAGRLFEPADVDQSPRVATRVQPQVPDDLVKRYPKDVVVVRVLVSQTGHPFRVSLLRRSLGGRSVDDAVVAAVSTWTFSPATKRGEAVSCWMNFGVPIAQ
jgi:TonB family protein